MISVFCTCLRWQPMKMLESRPQACSLREEGTSRRQLLLSPQRSLCQVLTGWGRRGGPLGSPFLSTPSRGAQALSLGLIMEPPLPLT